MAELTRQLHDYRLTTAEIIYCLPDHPTLLQQYIWQDYDVSPIFPTLKKFLHFWETRLEGKLFRVRVAQERLITDGDYRFADAELVWH
ncbi:MAG: hypothetical protein EBZ69_08220 [Alphaproteobacteria bacterium]|nr:hypothetical protein [Alphaproteobacteria bacterium]NDC56773.1 hypothetical protein [Alphaproteobacteria bacterium]